MNRNNPKQEQDINTVAELLPIGLNDPILQELWDVKDEINRSAGYDIHRLLANLGQSLAGCNSHISVGYMQ